MGNPGHRKLPATVVALEPAVMPTIPRVPTAGDELTEALWGLAGGWIAKTDALFLIPLVRDGWNRRTMLLEFLSEAGWSYESTGPLGNRLFSRPEAVELRNLEKQLTTWLSLLGLSPTDRSRLGVAEVKARTKLEELEERRAVRGAQPGRRTS